MAEPSVKDEPNPMSRAFCNPFAPATPISDSHSTDNTEPLWKQCDSRDRVDQVKINEEAAAHSQKFFENMEKVLNDFREQVTSCDTRLKEIAAIKNRKKHCAVRIGFLGGTGTGKSSLINSLLKMKVLPRSEEISSTAVPVEVSYNIDDDPTSRFKAVIEGISSSEFTKEVEDLFEYKQRYDTGLESDEDEVDDEMYQPMLNTFAKIKWLYPILQSIDDLNKTSAKKLLSEPHVKKMLDSKTSVNATTESTFAQQIKQYIESSKPKEGEKASISLWPLVKVVKIYVKADILKPGIILVDLPGSHDTSASRVAVTDNYRKNLTASVVCAPAVRAASDKVAQELLSSVERRNMQLDGLYTSDSLFFVVTKIDDLMDYEAYIKDHPNLHYPNEEDMETISATEEQIEKLEGMLSRRGGKQKKNRGVLQKMKDTHEKLATRVNKILDAKSLAGQKRKRIEEVTVSDEAHFDKNEKKLFIKLRDLNQQLSDKQNFVQREGSELYTMEQQKQRLENDLHHAESRVMKSCIRNRAQVHITAAREEYERARQMMGKQPSEKPLQVFSVSSAAFDHLTRGKKHKVQGALRKGFSTTVKTGIPALRDVLMAITWGIRQPNARSFNEDVESCLTRLKLWSADSASEHKMAVSKRAIVEGRMDAEIKRLEQAFSKLHSEIPSEVTQLVKGGIYKHLTKTARTSRKNALKTVIFDWTAVPWNTHRATNKRMGRWTSSQGHVFDWNEDLAGIYLQVLMKDWTETFHNYRPELLKKYEAQVDELIADFVEPVVTSAHDIHPTIDEALKSLKENILSLRTMLKDTAGDIFEGINQAAKEAHRAVNPEVAASWQSTYQKCGAERGVGHYDRNKKVHKEHLNSDGGFLMYKRAGITMQKMMNAALKKLPEKFEASFSNALTQLREDLRVTLDRHSVSNVEINDLPALASKGRLQKALKQHFDELEKSWGIEPESEIQDPDRVEPVTVEDIGDSEIDDFNPQDFERLGKGCGRDVLRF